MMEYKNIAEFENSTVAVSYVPISKAGTGYQSEQQMEERLIQQLCSQGYDQVPIHTEAELVPARTPASSRRRRCSRRATRPSPA